MIRSRVPVGGSRSLAPGRVLAGVVLLINLAGWAVAAEPQPPGDGVAVYLPAARQGDRVAQINLAAIHFYGLGTPRDVAQALHWYRQAASQGDPLAQFRLGVLYLEGQGVAADPAVAVSWFKQVAMSHLPRVEDLVATDLVGWSRWKLGVMYREGQGVAVDPVQSDLWFELAAARGFDRAGRRQVPGEPKRVDPDPVPPERPEPFSRLRVVSDPVGATVRIRNIRAPYQSGMTLPAGRYLVEVSNPGYRTVSRWLRLPGGGEYELSAPLEPVGKP
ncbi:MAG: SEL1-like repeat protein [Magnetococcales bacterium]|nr:SEL1-like repeat protein [Magnetococcales bacterium]